MNNILLDRNFYENGENHEKCNLSDMVFKDLDYEIIKKNISFFRSDFSRSRFYNCNFVGNLFGRADFIDVHIKNSDFSSVDFGSCLFKNALLEKTTFKKNRYHGVAIQYSFFKNCVFRDEQFVTNMHHCEFHECTFVGCSYKKSSLDNNVYINCEFIKVDISECIADNLKFDSCALRDVFLCANLWTTYLCKNTDIFNFGFKYRGQVTNIWNNNANVFINDLIRKQQYFEYINTIIIGDQIPNNNLLCEIKRILPLMLNQSMPIRKSSLTKFFDMLLFYRNSNRIAINDYIEIYKYLSEYSWNDLPINETLLYQSELYKIGKTIEDLEFDLSYICTMPLQFICVSTFHINTDDENKALTYLQNIFKSANCIFCNNAFEEPLIHVLQKEKGSVILTIASTALLTLLVSYVAKRVMHNFNSIHIELGIKNQIIKQLENSNGDLLVLKKNCELAQKYNFVSNTEDIKPIEKLSSELTKGEILNIIVNLLF